MVHIRNVTRLDAKQHLQSRGFAPHKADEIVESFDWSQPVYLSRLDEDDQVVQYLRQPWGGTLEGKAFDSSRNLGGFFGLPGATRDKLAIASGPSGRDLKTFVVERSITVLEGTAGPFDPNRAPPAALLPRGRQAKASSIRGKGGATQLVLSQTDKFALRPL